MHVPQDVNLRFVTQRQCAFSDDSCKKRFVQALAFHPYVPSASLETVVICDDFREHKALTKDISFPALFRSKYQVNQSLQLEYICIYIIFNGYNIACS